MARLSMVLIARNERDNVAPCFASFWDHVDEVVLCDTGSRDGTIGEARRVARERGEPDKLTVGRFKWCDDFAAARNHAHSLATGDVHGWLDLDGRLVGGENLPELAAEFDERAQLRYVAFMLAGPLHAGAQWEMRLLRPPVRWVGQTMEIPEEFPGQEHAPGEVDYTHLVTVAHTRTVPHGRRDLDIAVTWATREPGSSQAWMAAADEARDLGDWAHALEYGGRALSLLSSGSPRAARAYVLGGQAYAAYRLDDLAEAERLSLKAIHEFERAESWLLLSHCADRRLNLAGALQYAQLAEAAALTDDMRGTAAAFASRAATRLLLTHVAAAARE